jgi:uncharacterized protein (DUF1330 family)
VVHAPELVPFDRGGDSWSIGTEEWDRIIIVHYPSIQAFLKVTTSPEYERIAHLRTDALERAVLYAMVPIGRSWEEP